MSGLYGVENWSQGRVRKAVCRESGLHGVRREARYGIPAGSRRNWGEVPGLLAYPEVKTEGDQACQVSGACSKAL